MKRLLVTGSRDWTDVKTIYRALHEAWLRLSADGSEVVLVHGACHLGGADIIARDIWLGQGFRDEPHPAEMGPDGHVLGPKRNKEMVDAGADEALAFLMPQARGTRNCMRLVREANIPLRVYEPEAA